MKKNIVSFVLCFLLGSSAFVPSAFGQRRGSAYGRSEAPDFSYDLAFSNGTYNDKSYTEFNFGINWNIWDPLTWRNSFFSRSPSGESATGGLDSSIRYVLRLPFEGASGGVTLFAGPGYRFSDAKYSGIFAEAGGLVRAGWLVFGLGFKSLSYSNPGTNSDGSERSRRDTNTFFILGAAI